MIQRQVLLFCVVVVAAADEGRGGGGGGSVSTNDGDEIDAVRGLITRVFPQLNHYIDLELISAASASSTNQQNQRGGGGTFEIIAPHENTELNVTIRGTDGVALASGLHWYLKYTLGKHVSWGGDNLLDIPLPPPLPIANVSVTSPVEWRYSWNVCTMSYSMSFWDWPRWERELDFMALSGVNLPLAFFGQEYIWSKVYTQLGLTEEELEEHFAGPAFLAWQRMGNMRGWGGPLSPAAREEAKNLQLQILERARSFGMVPVLPCFAGHVPRGIERVFPEANVTQSPDWGGFAPKYGNDFLLEPNDPLFATIGELLMSVLASEFGANPEGGFYNCDMYNEMDPASADSEYLKSAGAAVIEAIRAGDAQGTWVMQAWLFHSGFWDDAARVEAYLSGVESDSMLVLDLNSEAGVLAWNYDSYFGKSFVWSMLHNYGGNRGVYGDLDVIASGPSEALAHNGSTMNGVGITPEAIEHNPVMYDLMFEQGWRSEPVDLSEWLPLYVERRYGLASSAATKAAQDAWQIIRTAAYSHGGIPPAIVQYSPSVGAHAPGDSNATGLAEAWRLLVTAAQLEVAQTGSIREPMRYDLVDFSRQAMTNFFQDVHALWSLEFQRYQADGTNSSAEVRALGDRLVEMIDELDELLATDSHFLLGSWIASARAAAPPASNATSNEGDLFEFNARNQITLWGPRGEINDYSAKQWSGLVRDYYGQRWELLVDGLAEAVSAGSTFDFDAFENELLLIGQRWCNETDPLATKFPVEPHGDSVDVASRLVERYAPSSVGNGYTVVNDTDHPGDDILVNSYGSFNLWTRDLAQLAVLCDMDSRCVGFNSNGWLKTEVASGQTPTEDCDLYIKQK